MPQSLFSVLCSDSLCPLSTKPTHSSPWLTNATRKLFTISDLLRENGVNPATLLISRVISRSYLPSRPPSVLPKLLYTNY